MGEFLLIWATISVILYGFKRIGAWKARRRVLRYERCLRDIARMEREIKWLDAYLHGYRKLGGRTR